MTDGNENPLIERKWLQRTLSVVASLCAPFILQTVVIVISARADSPFPDSTPGVAIYVWVLVGFSFLLLGFKNKALPFFAIYAPAIFVALLAFSLFIGSHLIRRF